MERSFPPVFEHGYLVSLIAVGLGPRVVVERDGQPVLDTFARLDIVPGRSQVASVALEELPYTLDFELMPSAKLNVLDSPYRLLLVDERPEEVSEMIDWGRGEVVDNFRRLGWTSGGREPPGGF